MEIPLETFFTGLQTTLQTAQQVRKVYDKELALEFNPLLHFFPVGENKFSQILAFFLNPKERHGQGSLFLDIFLDRPELGLAGKNLKGQQVKIKCEHRLPNQRRLDVHLKFQNFAIGIENKIWAGDQNKQLSDYNDYLKGQNGDNYLLLYWSPYGHLPAAHSISEVERERLFTSSHYRAIDHETFTSGLVEDWMRACSADRVRTFLRDFYQFIQHEINGEKFMGQNDFTTGFIMDSKKNFETALSVNAAFGSAVDTVIQKLKPKLEALATELEIEFGGFNMLPRKKDYRGFSFRIGKKVDSNVSIAFDWAGPYYKGGYFGFRANEKKEDASEYAECVAKLSTKFGAYNANGVWPWFKSFDEYASFSNQTYLDLYGENDKFVAAVKSKIEYLLKGLQEIEAGNLDPIQI